MRPKMSYAGILFLLGMLGCSASYKLVDSEGQESTVKKPQFSPQKAIDFKIGAAIRPVQASEIVSLSVQAQNPQVVEGRVFYPVQLLLNDSLAVPDTTSQDSSRVFMAVDGFLVADHAGSPLRLPLAELRQLYQYEPPKEPSSDSEK